MGGIALQGGEIIASGECKAVYDGTWFVLEYCTGGAFQVANAVQSQQAITLLQATNLASVGTPSYLLMAQGII
jgi:hypothetical protein